MNDLPRLLSTLSPAPGVIKGDYEDFLVEEIPLYSASGEGTHTYFQIEKRGLSTLQAAADLAAALNVGRREIGFAGMKDARAVARQWFSVEHVDPQRLRDLEIPRLRVLDVSRHTNKLRLGHLAGNRFEIKVRQSAPQRLAELQDGLRTLARRGVPNYFGPQRFGQRGDTWQVGRAVVRNQLDEALDLVLGRPSERDEGEIRRARELYEAGDFAEAARRWPGLFRDERHALKTLLQTGGRKKRAFLAIDGAVRRFYVSAYQSYLFNQVLAQRLPTGLDVLWEGDLAFVHTFGAVFRVQDAAAEQPRAERFEISPTGPLFGYRMTPAEGRAGEIEAALLAGEQLAPEAFRNEHLRLKGLRRPLRFPVGEAQIDLGADGRGPYLALSFTLPRGCYATALLRELFVAAPAGDGGGDLDDADPDD